MSPICSTVFSSPVRVLALNTLSTISSNVIPMVSAMTGPPVVTASVMIRPGQMALTVTPDRPTSAATALVNPLIPCLHAQ